MMSDPKNPQSRLDSWRRYGASELGKAANKRKKEKRRSTPSGQLDYILRNRRGLVRKKGGFFDDRLLDLAKNPPITCPCCHKPFIYGTGQGQNPRSPSVDKVISTSEYTLDDVMIICKWCNQIKNRGGIPEHLLVIAYMRKHDRRRSEGLTGRIENIIIVVKATIERLGKGTHVTNHESGRVGRKLKEESVRLRSWHRFENIIRNARAEAHRKGMPFDNDLLLLPQGELPPDCACCSVELLYNAEGQNPRSASIDAIDCSVGHTIDNVDIVCMECNANKSEGTIADHELIVAYIRKYAKHPEQ